MDEIPAEVSKQIEDLGKVTQEMYRIEHAPVHHIHIDLETLIDLNLGALFTLIHSDAEFQYILKNVASYEGSYDRKTAKYFPQLNITEEQIAARRRDPSWQTKVATMAPRTNLHDLLPLILQPIVQNNVLSPDHDKQPITLHFWTEGFIVPRSVQVRLCHAIFSARLPVAFNFHTEPLEKADAKYIDAVGLWFIYDICRFNRLENMNDAMCIRGSFAMKPVFAVRRVKDEFVNLPKKELATGLRDASDGMNLACVFNFFKYKLCREETT